MRRGGDLTHVSSINGRLAANESGRSLSDPIPIRSVPGQEVIRIVHGDQTGLPVHQSHDSDSVIKPDGFIGG